MPWGNYYKKTWVPYGNPRLRPGYKPFDWTDKKKVNKIEIVCAAVSKSTFRITPQQVLDHKLKKKVVNGWHAYGKGKVTLVKYWEVRHLAYSLKEKFEEKKALAKAKREENELRKSLGEEGYLKMKKDEAEKKENEKKRIAKEAACQKAIKKVEVLLPQVIEYSNAEPILSPIGEFYTKKDAKTIFQLKEKDFVDVEKTLVGKRYFYDFSILCDKVRRQRNGGSILRNCLTRYSTSKPKVLQLYAGYLHKKVTKLINKHEIPKEEVEDIQKYAMDETLQKVRENAESKIESHTRAIKNVADAEEAVEEAKREVKMAEERVVSAKQSVEMSKERVKLFENFDFDLQKPLIVKSPSSTNKKRKRKISPSSSSSSSSSDSSTSSKKRKTPSTVKGKRSRPVIP